MIEDIKISVLFTAWWNAMKSDHTVFAHIIFANIVYELIHNDMPFKIEVATRDENGERFGESRHDYFHLIWEDRMVYCGAISLSSEVIMMLYKRSPKMIDRGYYHVSVSETFSELEIIQNIMNYNVNLRQALWCLKDQSAVKEYNLKLLNNLSRKLEEKSP